MKDLGKLCAAVALILVVGIFTASLCVSPGSPTFTGMFAGTELAANHSLTLGQPPSFTGPVLGDSFPLPPIQPPPPPQG